jgi:cation diffusion facilitator family transporter
VTRNLESGGRLALLGIIVNLLLAIIKIVAGVVGNAYALIADGIESTLDIASSFIIWCGLKVAARPPDDTHPYGHGKAEPIAAIVVSLAVLAAAVGLAVESVREIFLPHHAPKPFTLAVLVLVVITKELLFFFVLKAGQRAESLAIKTDAWHHLSDALTSTAAFIGISIALIGGKGWESSDDVAALFACGIIAYNGYRLLKPALYEIMDTAPPEEVRQRVKDVATGVDGVIEVEKCRVRKMGLEYYVDIHVRVDGSIPVREGHKIAHAVKDAVRDSNPVIADVLVHIEPTAVQNKEAPAV